MASDTNRDSPEDKYISAAWAERLHKNAMVRAKDFIDSPMFVTDGSLGENYRVRWKTAMLRGFVREIALISQFFFI